MIWLIHTKIYCNFDW